MNGSFRHSPRTMVGAHGNADSGPWWRCCQGLPTLRSFLRWEGAEGLSSALCQWSFAITQKTFGNNLILPNVHILSNSSEGSEPDSATHNRITHLLRGFRWHCWNVSRWLISTGEQRGKVGSDASETYRRPQENSGRGPRSSPSKPAFWILLWYLTCLVCVGITSGCSCFSFFMCTFVPQRFQGPRRQAAAPA